MIKWEYRVFSLERTVEERQNPPALQHLGQSSIRILSLLQSTEEHQAELNSLGKQGWELVGVVGLLQTVSRDRIDTTETLVYMKRPFQT